MALRMAATAMAAAAPRGLLRRFCTSPNPTFAPWAAKSDWSSKTEETPTREMAEPNCNLFVSGLSKRTTTEGLREAFAKFGEVDHARVVTDRVNGYSKGFGFVRYVTLEDAAKGIEGMDGKFLDGWVIFAEYARPRAPLPNLQSQNNMSPPPYRNNNMGGDSWGRQ